MRIPPPEVLLSWPKPNYVSPVVRGPELLVVTCVLFPVVLCTVALRCFTRVYISKSFGLDDWLLLAAIIPTMVCAALSILTIQRWGWNRHIWDVPPDLVILGLKVTIAIECSFGLAVSFTKLSMLILTRRVLARGTGIMRHIASFLLFVVAAEGVIFCLTVTFTCTPPSQYWTLSVGPQKCINEKLHLVIGGMINSFTDFGVVFLPLPVVIGLSINRNQQIMLGGLFGAGFVICMAGIFRIYFEFRSFETYDRTWASFGLWISSLIELYVGVICTSIPACKPFFSRYLPIIFGSSVPTQNTSPTHSSAPRPPNFQRSIPSEAQEKRDSQFSEHVQAVELKKMPISKFNTKFIRTSRLLRPLSSLGIPTSPGRSRKTSISSFIGGNVSPLFSESHASRPSAADHESHLFGSKEELVGPQVP